MLGEGVEDNGLGESERDDGCVGSWGYCYWEGGVGVGVGEGGAQAQQPAKHGASKLQR